MRIIPVITLALVAACPSPLRAEPDEAFQHIRAAHQDNADALFANVLRGAKIPPLQGGFAQLWLNRDLAEGNRMLRQAIDAIIVHEGGSGEMTDAIAGSEYVKWQMRTWNRLYQLFHDESRFYPGRLDQPTQAMIEDMLWRYVATMSNFERAAPQYVWGIHGSENHEMMHYSNCLLASQALKDRPEYAGRSLPDGRSLTEHYEAWNAYYKLYCLERAKHGLLIECFSGYGKYTLPELVNLCDLSADPLLRARMEKLLHLIWADWAVGQINGVRGGGRLRIYQGDPAMPARQRQWGSGDSWLIMSRFLLESGTWLNPRSFHPDPIIGFPWVLATTRYRLPDVIMDLATDVAGRGEYTYVSRRVAKQQRMPASDVPVTSSPWYALDADDPRMLGYDHCTPDYVMGSLIIDPTLPLVSSHVYLQAKDLDEGYPAQTSQNRYHGIVFATDCNARVVPQCEGLGSDKTYGEQQAIQHRNVMLVQRHPKARGADGMRILFGGDGMKDRLVYLNGWLVLEEGEAWLGIKGFSRTKPNQSCGYRWDNDVFLRMHDGDAPVALIAGRREDHPDLDAFGAYLETFSGTIDGGWLTLETQGPEPTTLALHLSAKALPKVNGVPVDLSPPLLFDSPFLRSEHGSGITTIRKGVRELVVDMTEAAQ